MIDTLRWLTRIAGLFAFALGLTLRITGFAPPAAVGAHMSLGGLVALVLAILAVWALIDRVKVPIALGGLLWALAIFYVGTLQDWGIGASSHVGIEIAHVLLGVGAIGLAETLGTGISRRRASR